MRNATYEELLKEVIKEYELKDIKTENVRLRSFNVLKQVLQDTYTGREMKTLEELRIYPQKTLALEIKTEEQKFEEYDPNFIQLKINTWKPGMIALDEQALNPIKIRISKNAKLSELLKSVEEITKIPYEDILLGKKLPMGNASSFDILSIPKNEERSLVVLAINDGLNVFVENKKEEYPHSEDALSVLKEIPHCKWETEFEMEKNRYTLKFNHPREFKEDLPINYQYYINIDRRQTVENLKFRVGKELGLEPSKLILRRGGVHGIELKNDTLSIKDAHFYNMASVFVEEGIPTAVGEQRLQIYEAKYINSEIDNQFFEFQLIWSGAIHTMKSVLEFKEELLKKLEVPPRHLRLREKNNDKLTKVYHDQNQMESYNIFDGKQLAIQYIDAPEKLEEEDYS